MKAIRIIQGIGIAAVGAWLAFWAWIIGKWVLLLPISDPTGWLLDKEYQSVAMDILGVVMFLIPFLSLLTFIVPALKIQFSRESGDGVMSIRLQKMSKSQALISWSCLAITLAWWGILFVSRMGWV